ncbi:mitochondrial protein [Kwoniella heveanensis CBS 569]|uniref:Mitochondrial protein n=1 Tax=Kwoniella heveanensis BCC8398 TaxID=1296120 RepID=A0A1B9GR44_9TREE|nr:mitochondrial protein [Kwoniella heveanensis BCC8398]OCF42605.1 mitochondrial protein [Kwoniella heveanensis CBS 569]
MLRNLPRALGLASTPIRHLALRRLFRARPILVPSSIPPQLCRSINIQAPGASSPDSERREASLFEPSTPPIISTPPPQYDNNSDPSSSSGSSSSSTVSANTSLANASSLPAPPEGTPTFIPRHLQHPFDTHAFVSYLEKSNLSRGTSRALMEAVREMIIKRGTQTRNDMVGKEDAENAAYLFNAALSELRTELSVQARNDGLALKAMAGAIRREVDGLEQKITEDVQVLKHDIEMDMNNRKAETRTEIKGFDIYIEEINNKFTISLGDLRTEIESVKWDATRRAISIIILIVVATIAISTFIQTEAEPGLKVESKPTSSPSSTATMRDMAVGTDDGSLEEDVKTYTEERLEKLLSDSGVAKLERRRSRSGSGSHPRDHQIRDDRSDLHVDRI